MIKKVMIIVTILFGIIGSIAYADDIGAMGCNMVLIKNMGNLGIKVYAGRSFIFNIAAKKMKRTCITQNRTLTFKTRFNGVSSTKSASTQLRIRKAGNIACKITGRSISGSIVGFGISCSY